jgi:hypothetical protein
LSNQTQPPPSANPAAPPADRESRTRQITALNHSHVLALYERLIGGGIAAADGRGTIIDHVTARRLAITVALKRNVLKRSGLCMPAFDDLADPAVVAGLSVGAGEATA